MDNTAKAGLKQTIIAYLMALLPIYGLFHSRLLEALPENSKPLAIGERLQESDVTIIGWGHSKVNTFIPQAVAEELASIVVAHKVSLVLEKSPEDFNLESLPENEKSLAKRAIALGVPVIPGDLYNSNLSNMTLMEHIADLVPGKISNEIALRDQNFANIILQEFNRGHKVIILIGYGHVDNLHRVLSDNGLKVSSVHTTWDFKTREVRIEGQLYGITERDEEMETLNDLLKVLSRKPDPFERAASRVLDAGAKCVNFLKSVIKR